MRYAGRHRAPADPVVTACLHLPMAILPALTVACISSGTVPTATSPLVHREAVSVVLQPGPNVGGNFNDGARLDPSQVECGVSDREMADDGTVTGGTCPVEVRP